MKVTKKRKMEDRFFEKVNKTPGCWLWTSSTGNRGYGDFHYLGKTVRAHRLSYEITYGQIPKNLVVMHLCDNRICVNPSHLVLGTVAANQADMKLKGRSRNSGGRGEQSSHHKLTEQQVLEIRKLWQTAIYTKQELGNKFGVTRQSIGMIVNRKQWTHI